MKPPIYVYYELDNYFQNHRRYVKSRSSLQLLGEVRTLACAGQGNNFMSLFLLTAAEKNRSHVSSTRETKLLCGKNTATCSGVPSLEKSARHRVRHGMSIFTRRIRIIPRLFSPICPVWFHVVPCHSHGHGRAPGSGTGRKLRAVGADDRWWRDSGPEPVRVDREQHVQR